jgi:hypothetical protein
MKAEKGRRNGPWVMVHLSQETFDALHADCSVAWTPAGEATNEATADDIRIAAGEKPRLVGVTAGMKVSVITNS